MCVLLSSLNLYRNGVIMQCIALGSARNFAWFMYQYGIEMSRVDSNICTQFIYIKQSSGVCDGR